MASSRIELLGTSPSVNGLRWQSEQRLRIGRQGNLDIVIQDSSLNQQHAEIRVTPKGWVVQDLGNGTTTYLNGVPLGKLARKLQAKDVLHCGRLTFKVDELQWQAPEPPSFLPQDIRTSGPLVRVQALSQLSWEQGLRGLATDEQPSVPHAKHFLTLLRAGHHLSRIESVTELLQTLLDDTVAVLDAQRGAILLWNEPSGMLVLKSFSGIRLANSRGYSNTLAQRCFSKGESLLCRDVQAVEPATGSLDLNNMNSIICALLRSPRRRLGVLHLDRGPRQEPFSEQDFELADAIAATVSVGIESAIAVEKQRAQFFQEVIAMVQQVMAVRDESIRRHCEQVAELSLLLADELRLTVAERENLRLGALLHDIGEIAVADQFLGQGHGPGSECVPERRQHPLQGLAIAEKISGFAPALPVIRSHHECWDGSGFPDGLRGEQIPRSARIVAVADMACELAHAHPLDEVMRRCGAAMGISLDPEVVNALGRLASQAKVTIQAPPTNACFVS